MEKQLLLLSKNFTNEAARKLIGMVGGKKAVDIKIAFSSNAADHSLDFAFVEKLRNEILAAGFKLTDFDVKKYNLKPAAFDTFLSTFDCVFWSGGSSLYLMYLLSSERLAETYANLVNAHKFVHVGSSAGALICSPSMKYYRLMDVDDYIPGQVDKGLNLCPFYIVPHYIDKPKYTKLYDLIKDQYLEKSDILIPLKNDDFIAMNGNKYEIFKV